LFFILSLPFIDEPLAFNLSTILEAVPASFHGNGDRILAVITSDDLAELTPEFVTLLAELLDCIIVARG
jgi:hypothetical protein